MKLSPEQLEEILPTDDVREAFMRREDIAGLPDEERERLWAEHLEKLKPFLRFLTRTECVVVRRS
jgi:hypothetical protein